MMKQEYVANGIHYTLHGDEYLPDIEIPEGEHRPIAPWGLKRLEFLQEKRPEACLEMVKSGRLYSFLAWYNERVDERYQSIMGEMLDKYWRDNAWRMTEEEWRKQIVAAENFAGEIVEDEMVYK